MNQQTNTTEPAAADVQPFVITRVLKAPRDLVWKAWTEPERLAKWWGPKGCSITVHKMDLRPGGTFHYTMSFSEGGEMWGRFAFREIAAPERLVWVNSFSDADGGITRPPFEENWPLEILNEVRLTEEGGHTLLTLRATPINATAEEAHTFDKNRESLKQGYSGTWDQLEEYLAELSVQAEADREIIMTRFLKAPRELVFEAWTKPEHVAHWFGPDGFTLTTHQMEVRPGGMWRYIMHGPDGKDYDNRVVYEEISRPERLVYLHGSDRDDDPEAFHVTVSFTEEDGGTRLTMRMVTATAEQREAMIGFGAIEGGNQTLSRLEFYLATMA